MKKYIFTALLLVSSLATLANAKFFLGIDGGYSMDSVDVKVEDKIIYQGTTTTTIPGSFTENAYKGNGYVFNINLGTEHHFDRNNYVGFRWFLSGGYGRTTLINQKDKSTQYPSSIIQANLGIDLLLDVIKFGNHSLGLFGGVEGGVNAIFSDAFYYDNNNRKFFEFTPLAFVVSPRIGLSLFLSEHHRIEFVTKIPVYTLAASVADKNNNFRTLISRPIQFMLGYKFVF